MLKEDVAQLVISFYLLSFVGTEVLLICTFLSLWLKHPRVPGLCPDSQGAHKNHLLDNLSIEDTRPECKKVIGSLEQCWLHEVCVICSLTSQDECEGTGSTRPHLTSALRLTLQH